MSNQAGNPERTQMQPPKLDAQRIRSKRPGAGLLVVLAMLVIMVPTSPTNTAEAQNVTFNENAPLTSGCYKPALYEHGVNMAIKVYSNTLTTEDLRTIGIDESKNPFGAFSQIEAGRLGQVIAKDLSRLKDTGIVVDNGLPKESDDEIPVYFEVTINLEETKLTSGRVTGYVAATQLNEICSVSGKGKDLVISTRRIEVPGMLILPTLDEMVRNVEDLVYDHVMDAVKARRQALGHSRPDVPK